MNEFELIQRFFMHSAKHPMSVPNGDDCAVFAIDADNELAVSSDTIVEGVHFPPYLPAHSIGYRGLAAALSDLAAMGADARSFTVAITLARDLERDGEAYLSQLSAGILDCARRFDCDWVGGDLTTHERGPLIISYTVMGSLPKAKALTRSGARYGDDIYVSGVLGKSRLGLQWLLDREPSQRQALMQHFGNATIRDGSEFATQLGGPKEADGLIAFCYPTPRLALGVNLRSIAHSAIDISDGLIADLAHICDLSSERLGGHLGARLRFDQIPIVTAETWQQYDPRVYDPVVAFTHGDDYELCFTAAPRFADHLKSLSQQLGLGLHKIGEIIEQPGVQCLDANGDEITMTQTGYRHVK